MPATPHTPIYETDFRLPGQTNVYHGKVRDVYSIGNEQLVIVTTDRISAFDHVLPVAIPYKGQVLTEIASHFLSHIEHICPHWLTHTIAPQVMVGHRCTPLLVEVIIRGYLAGHAWRQYNAGHRSLCGVSLPEGLRQNDRLPTPILTPSTKAQDGGHDEDITESEILAQEIVSPDVWEKVRTYAFSLFDYGQQMAAERGLILVDTKYEFGIDQSGEVRLIDEIHTPDSSRYFYTAGYEERQSRGEAQKQLSKEFVREWLLSKGFGGQVGETMPTIDEAFADEVSHRYIELHEQMTGLSFSPKPTSAQEIENEVINYLNDH